MSIRNLYAGLVGEKVTVVTFPREDIECRNTGPALASLERLIASREGLEASNGTISLLVCGYDEDPRELHLIPEVRAYFFDLDDQFPFWFHICTRIEHSLRMVFTMLAEMTLVALEPQTLCRFRTKLGSRSRTFNAKLSRILEVKRR